MRLLRMQEDGDLNLEDHTEEDKPSYAILSHRWGKDYEEVTFKDMMDHTYRDKRGYEKIRGCGEQAKRNDHQLFWIDTCCIDKSSSAELSESINSMWRWYCNSQVCYVYLDDVRADIDEAEKDTAFTESKWFTRGWTLQELLAPPRLEFYDAEWNIIGTKDDLAEKISEITKIDKLFLHSNITLLKQASIAERMSWASKRTTKRAEDIAYCLLGIFDINMPLLYGEGAKAFQRLQEEIVKHSDDQSILAWTSPSAEIDSGKLFAHSPAAFASCEHLVRSMQSEPVKPYSITNKGLEISLPLLRGAVDGEFLAVLNCTRRLDTFGSLALPVKQKGSSRQYQRRNGELQPVPFTDWDLARVQPMCISMQPLADYSTNHLKDNTSILRALPKGLKVSQIFPSGPRSHETHTFEGNRSSCPQDPDNRTLVVLSSGTTRCYLFMTFFRENWFFHDYVWDARLLPVLVDDSSDIEQIFNAWNYKDLSTLQRVQHSSYGRVALRTVAQVIQGRRVTIIEILDCRSDDFIRPRNIYESLLVVVRSIGYRLCRVIYWTFDLLFKGGNLLDLTWPAAALMLFCIPYLSPSRDPDKYQTPKMYIISTFLIFVFVRWNIWRMIQQLQREERIVLGWQDVREFDPIIGYTAVLVVVVFLPCILVERYLEYNFGAMWMIVGALASPIMSWYHSKMIPVRFRGSKT
ncbi:heterokaryon incompatibility protein-domain-containing protein [Alternaria rosae]|uniref:heterokaryon incompatibility protein-domain-containing protein n=1 Tax=Alternaria rosae TaxID=1187941 RepID=UPI001E8E027E|nr:heterokaryon incompatibility protein-domain-containing protein [Alternaria rosae]KAH6865266.1 heterokaryon incompatibility protein-domain-containing protein [Alternaria rosae]